MLSKQTWREEAERAAARKFGEDNKGWFVFRRYWAGPLAVVLFVGALAYGVRWVYLQATAALDAPSASPPMVYAVVVGLLAVVTGIAFRPGQKLVMFHVFLIKVFVFGLAWLGLIAYGLAVML